MTFREHEVVELVRDLPLAGLVAGTVGAIVWVYPDHCTFEVEFFDGAGNTTAVVTVGADCIRARS